LGDLPDDVEQQSSSPEEEMADHLGAVSAVCAHVHTLL